MSEFVSSLGVFGLGMLVIFSGILIIIGFVVLQKLVLGLFSNDKKPKKQINIKQPEKVETVSNEIPMNIRLAIIAAISAYYDNNNNSVCEFKVKRIKRLG